MKLNENQNICAGCEYIDVRADEYPCVGCGRLYIKKAKMYVDRYKPKRIDSSP